MFTLFLRGAVLYIVMILVVRGLGKRQLGEFVPFELAMTILLAEVIAAPMESVSVPLLNGLLPVAAMFVVHSLLSVLSLRFDGVRAFLSGRPQVVIQNGRTDRQALDRLCLGLSDLLEGLREAGFPDPTQVDEAIVEVGGGISAFAGGDGVPLAVIMDGHIQRANLERAVKDEAWLNGMLMKKGLTAPQVYLGLLDKGGQLTIQTMGETA